MICLPGFISGVLGLLLMVGAVRDVVVRGGGYWVGRRVKTLRPRRRSVTDVESHPTAARDAGTSLRTRNIWSRRARIGSHFRWYQRPRRTGGRRGRTVVCLPWARCSKLVGLRRRYGNVVALDDLSFDVPAGQVVGFLGPNGAGKTTTMRAIFGLVDLEAGSVSWDGAPVGQAERRRFGYMPEERGLYPGMLVGDQIEYLGRLHGLSPTDAAAATGAGWNASSLADRRHSKVETLSHGNQQRVQLAAALVHDPELLVLDEPLSGSGSDRDRRHRPGPGGSGPGRMLRALQQPPTRPGGGPLRAGDDH